MNLSEKRFARTVEMGGGLTKSFRSCSINLVECCREDWWLAFFSGSFSAAKGIDILISQINELQAKVNSMGMPPSITTILSKVDDARAQILAMQSSQVRPRA